jgi:hypothetical protein
MRRFAIVLVGFFIIGCSIGFTVHDEDRAADLVVEFLNNFKTNSGIQSAYDWTDEKFKERVSFQGFTQMVKSIQAESKGADIHLIGYETFGTEEIFQIYATSENSDRKLHFRFALVGTKSKDYRLYNMSFNDKEFEKKGIYKEYAKSNIIGGV